MPQKSSMQKAKDHMVQDLHGVKVIMDDLIVAGDEATQDE